MNVQMLTAPILLLFCFYADVYGVELTSGVRQEFGMSFTDEQRAALPVVSKAIKTVNGQEKHGLSLAFVNIAGTDIWYRLYENMHVYGINVAQEMLLGAWPLARWPHQYYSPDIKKQFAEIYADYPLPFEYEAVAPGAGCLGNSPLRYGDIEGNGPKELVVILGGLFIVFSPEYQRIVFSEYLDESDWYTEAEAKAILEGQSTPAAQYISQLWIDNSNRKGPGVRAYAKLYFGDFDKDGNPDILAWRKSYRSNAASDPIKGFTKLRDSWGHFERDLKAQEATEQGVTGEYLPQETEESAVQQWLAEKGLTWKTGYPSTSECDGQAGEFIPEFHDPLLNDPQVLQ